MTALDPDESHSEAITLGLHDASPQHMVDAMADDVVLEMGWGRLDFRADLRRPGEARRGAAARGARVDATSASTLASLMFWSPEHLPNCSSTPATPTG